MRVVLAVAVLSLAASACGSHEPTSLACGVNLAGVHHAKAVDARELTLAANQTALEKVGPYTVTFHIVGTPIHGQGAIRIGWAGPDLTTGTVSGGFDVRHVASIEGQMNVPSGTLHYSCGAVGGFA